jgi:hypothetical protein
MAQMPGARSAAAGLSAAALFLLTACAQLGGSAPGGGFTPGGTVSSAPPSSPDKPQKALLTAAVAAQRITSAVETIDVSYAGAEGRGATGTIRFRLKPAVRVSENLRVTANGKTTRIKAILTAQAIYLDAAAMGVAVGKPWVKISLNALKGTAAAQIVQGIQSNSFRDQVQLPAYARDAHVVGTQTIDGVRTTEYAGSFRFADAYNAMPVSLRKALATQAQQLGNSVVRFREWVDGQHHVRRLTEIEPVDGTVATVTVNVNAINQPVQITLPPASEVTTQPVS